LRASTEKGREGGLYSNIFRFQRDKVTVGSEERHADKPLLHPNGAGGGEEEKGTVVSL